MSSVTSITEKKLYIESWELEVTLEFIWTNSPYPELYFSYMRNSKIEK